jgi:hypothetical protein
MGTDEVEAAARAVEAGAQPVKSSERKPWGSSSATCVTTTAMPVKKPRKREDARPWHNIGKSRDSTARR